MKKTKPLPKESQMNPTAVDPKDWMTRERPTDERTTAEKVPASKCRSGETWTLEDEAADIERETLALRTSKGWSSDIINDPFLHYIHPDKQLAFIEHLKNGRLRTAFAMIADGAFRCGMIQGGKLIAGKRAKIINNKDETQSVEFLPQKIPPGFGVIVGNALHQKMPRKKLAMILRKGGKIVIGKMSPVDMPPLSQKDVNECLNNYPHKDKRGRKKKRKTDYCLTP